MQADDPEVVSAFTAFLGVELDEMADGFVRLVLDTSERHTKSEGGVHEGVVLTMMDSALGMAIRLARGLEVSAEAPHATIEMNASLIRGVQPGERLIVEGRVVEVGDLLATGEAEARKGSDGEIVAVSRLTFIIPNRGG